MINDKWTDNHIETEGAIMISETLKINTTLTDLSLEGDEIEVKNEKFKITRIKWIYNKNEIIKMKYEQITILEKKEQ